MEFIENLIPENLIYSLGAMLLHMLWQAIIIALLLGFILILLRKSSPQSRYVSALAAFSLMPVTAVITFISQWSAFSYHSEIQTQAIPLGTFQSTGNTGILDQLLTLYADYLPVIVFIWIIGVTVLLLKSMGQLILLHRLKSYYLKELAAPVQDTIQRIAQKFKINKSVKAFISSKAGSPMIIGHRKPVLLLPESTVNNLSIDELKAVLQHELAHIKRNDYIINLFQSVIEILFFFHPATWWISAIIRKEREECCDVYAIENEKDRLNLARALTTIQEMEIGSSAFAMSALRKNKNLLKRIKNMFTNRPVTPSFKEGIIVTLFFVALILCMSFIFNDATPGNSQDGDKNIRTVSTELPDGKHLFAQTDEAGNIEKLYVEGKKVPKRKYGDYKFYIDSLHSLESANKPASHFTDKRAIEAKAEEAEAKAVAAKEKAKQTEAKAIEAEIQKALAEINKNLSAAEKEQLSQAANGNSQFASQILSEITNSISQELKKEFGEHFHMQIDATEDGEKVVMRMDGNNFIMDINNEQEKVIMRLDESGFIMDVNEDGEQVKMRIDSTGFYIHVTENGKETVNIKFGPDGAVFDVDE